MTEIRKNDLQTKGRIAWHPAFFEAIQMELADFSQELEFIPEHQLSKEPLRIDVLIIKKTSDVSIKKNIAAIFRKDNIVEYKSPDDYISIENFYMVYAYACLYLVMNKADVNNLTLTFVGSRHPRELLAHFQKVRGYTVEEKWPGIYIVKGDILPIQLIDNRKLSAGENIWLKGLDNRLRASEFLQVTNEAARRGNAARLRAYLEVISRANTESLWEAYKMSNTKLTLEQVLEEVGLTAKWEARGIIEGEARGEERKASEIAQNMLRNGFSAEQTAELSGLDIAKIRELSEAL